MSYPEIRYDYHIRFTARNYVSLLLSTIIMMMVPLSALACGENTGSIEKIIMDYPHGKTGLYVDRSGYAHLSFGPLPRTQEVKTNTFNIDDHYQHLLPRLHENVPREEWPDPKYVAGLVTIVYKDKTEKVYLIFDAKEFAEEIFNKARKNRLDPDPKPWPY